MDAVTYPNPAVQKLLAGLAVPVRVDVLKDRDLAKRFRAYWTPLFVIADADGRELQRDLGFLPPDEFSARALLSFGLAEFQQSRYEQALQRFEEIVANHPSSHVAPEATYWKGVCAFKRSKDTKPIYEACRQIVARYPGSVWANKIGFVTRYKDFNLT